jgi:hypothetical protein
MSEFDEFLDVPKTEAHFKKAAEIISTLPKGAFSSLCYRVGIAHHHRARRSRAVHRRQALRESCCLARDEKML